MHLAAVWIWRPVISFRKSGTTSSFAATISIHKVHERSGHGSPNIIPLATHQMDHFERKAQEENSRPKRNDDAETLPAYDLEKSPWERIVFRVEELDIQPEILLPLNLDSEFGPNDDHLGTARVLLLVSAEGKVTWSYVEQSDFDEATTSLLVDKFKLAPFTPGRTGNQPVDTVIRIEISRTAEQTID